jgi:hypothetical protein
MKSSWDTTKHRSQYHFDTSTMDERFDTNEYLGNVGNNWQEEVAQAVANARPATWRTRGQVGKTRPEEELASEEYDLERAGYSKDQPITHLNWNIPTSLQAISDAFGFDDCMNRIHVQMPGEVWNLHLDKLEKWCPEDPSRVMRIMIQLTDWQQGHFWSYGNFVYQGWKAGDVTTFDWQNVPHSTANAGHTPRVTFQITGIITDKTIKFLEKLKSN